MSTVCCRALGKAAFLFIYFLCSHAPPLNSLCQAEVLQHTGTSTAPPQKHRRLWAPWTGICKKDMEHKARSKRKLQLSISESCCDKHSTDSHIYHLKLTFLFADDNSFWSCSHSLFKLNFSCSMALTIPDWLWCFWCFRERMVDSSCRI